MLNPITTLIVLAPFALAALVAVIGTRRQRAERERDRRLSHSLRTGVLSAEAANTRPDRPSLSWQPCEITTVAQGF
jgi:hypothetical protein